MQATVNNTGLKATQLFTTTDGKTARLVNPYSSNTRHETPEEEKERGKNFHEFEESVQPYPIHSDKPIEGVFEGEVVWQARVALPNGEEGYLQCSEDEAKEKESFGIETRQAVQPVPVKGEGKVEAKQSVGVYHVCHSCQVSGLRNCSEFDKCGNDKTYPAELRENTQRWYKSGFPLSVIAEKSFDMGHALASANMVELERVLAELELHFQYFKCENKKSLLTQIKNLKQGKE